MSRAEATPDKGREPAPAVRAPLSDAQPEAPLRFINFVHALNAAALFLAGAYFGQNVLVPVILALLGALALLQLDRFLARVPVVSSMPVLARRLLVLLILSAAFLVLAVIATSTLSSVMTRAPAIAANFLQQASSLAAKFSIDPAKFTSQVDTYFRTQFKLADLVTQAFSLISTAGSMIFVVTLYAGFILSERAGFAEKLAHVIASPETRSRVESLIARTADSVGRYIAVMSLINLISGGVSLVILWLFGVDFALFWALLIAIFNFIPYVGSIFAIGITLFWTLGQFGDFTTPLYVAALLIGADMYIGNILQPRMIGKEVNLSPFVVMLSLALWSALWGGMGAILAVPLTSAMVIILAAFQPTIPLARLMTTSGKLDSDPES